MVVVPFGISGCAHVDINEDCEYSSELPLYESDPESMSLYIGAPPTWANQDPYLVLNERSDGERVVTIELQLQNQPLSWPTNLDVSRCVGVEWKRYALLANVEEWTTYWESTKKVGFSYGIVFPDAKSRVRSKSFGFAFVSDDHRATVASCGCLWK